MFQFVCNLSFFWDMTLVKNEYETVDIVQYIEGICTSQ